jgi:hypothetical protein
MVDHRIGKILRVAPDKTSDEENPSGYPNPAAIRLHAPRDNRTSAAVPTREKSIHLPNRLLTARARAETTYFSKELAKKKDRRHGTERRG